MSSMHYLDLVCDGYAGNFELELVSYVFNSPEYDNERRDYSKFLTPEEQAETDRVLTEEFLDYFYGEYGLASCELVTGKHPVTSKSYAAVRVHVTDFMWQTHGTAEAIELIKARAEAFFPLYLAKLPSYLLKEGAFVELLHITVETSTTVEAL